MKNEKEIKYKNYAFKLSKKTIKLLRIEKKKSGKSWNLFYYYLIKNNGFNQVSTKNPDKEI